MLFDRVKNMFSSTVLGGGNVIPESNEWYVVSLNYAMSEEFYSLSEQAWRERDPRFACCDNLIKLAELDGVYPRPATFAQGYIRVTGAVGSALIQSMEFQFGQQKYSPVSTVPAEIPVSGEVIIRASAVEPGSDGNVPSSTTNVGQLLTPLPGIDNAVTVYGGRFCGGAPAETCEQLRSRYLDRMRYKSNYGVDWVKQKVLEWPCVTMVCERSGSCCTVTLDQLGQTINCTSKIEVYAIFDDTFPCGLAPACVTDEITEWLFGEVQGMGTGQAEWGMIGKVYTATAAYVDVIIDGLSCTSPSQASEIEARVYDFTSTICPSQPLQLNDLKVIISQLMGTTVNYDVVIRPVIVDDPNIYISACGDADPSCDYKICVREVQFVNGSAVNTGACI